MSAKTESSDISKKVHSYFASLSSASSRILDDVKSISLASRRSHRSWNNLNEKEKSNIVMESLVPDDVEQKYRSLDSDALSPLGVPSSQMESLIDASQAFPVVEISTSKPMPRSVVIEEEINGRKVPITWRDEHSVPFSWYNQSCEPIVANPPPFVCLTSPEDFDHPEINGDGLGSGARVSRRSSRASTPERRRSPLMRPRHAPPPPPAPKDPHLDRKKDSPPVYESSGTGNRLDSISQESISSVHGQGMRSSSAPQHNQKKRQAPRPPVSPIPPQAPERSSTLSLTSVGSNPDRPRSTFCPADDPNQPHILPEALAPEKLDCKSSPLLQNAKSKAPPQQLKKVSPPVAPKIEYRPPATESIAPKPSPNDNIPKTGFDFLDNW
ncbi:uncharacterized protein C1orf198 homolog [Galendromus occidentalis]|uniref:Uncharacterized protein C1orf198 homolog n=1 Tax=Galendromus occidentalis TaxID=34638 RepID=A0AAJ7WHX1_9ACAR|nr:uncharacterized protein C1orf198 homolog [Galendromus occidentalis]